MGYRDKMASGQGKNLSGSKIITGADLESI
jgi:hypothetical protein